MEINRFKAEMSALAENQKPFFFLIDFEQEDPIVCPIDKAEELGFYFQIKKFNFTWPLYLLRNVTGLMVTVFFLPITGNGFIKNLFLWS